MSRFQIVILSGPSGSGKTTIVEHLLKESPIRLVKSVSATTRAARPGEEHGVAYYFLSPEEFALRRSRGEFLETAEVFGHGTWYGTLRSEIDRARAEGGWAFLEIDVQGARSVLKTYPDAISIFIHPPSLAVCEERIRARGVDSEEVIQKRLRKVSEELRLSVEYQHQVRNDDLVRAVAEICQILADAAASS